VSHKIHILPEALCNQIAAGEVVERPASVVKELVENSLDAGASRIQVEIENGGKRLIRVTDNGSGMPREDAFLCLERHATSKVRAEQDLFRLTTLGFRGEALPSIAAISRFSLRTRIAEALEGWEIIAEGGTVKRASEVGVPPGTSIEIRNLFFNTPARRKFLRTDETELGHIGETLTRLALSSPEVCFRFVHNGRLLWEVNRQNTLAERVAELLGRQVVRDMLCLDCHGPEGMRLSGLISRPSLSRAGLGSVYTFINGRFIRDRVVQHALGDGYRNLLEKGRHPVLVLFLEVEPSQVDVNVHPTKHEVRFRQQALVHDFIVQSLRDHLSMSSQTTPGKQGSTPFAMPERESRLPAKPPMSKGGARTSSAPFPTVVGDRDSGSSVPSQTQIKETLTSYPSKQEITVLPKEAVCPAKSDLFGTQGHPDPQVQVQTSGFFSGLRIIGQYQNSYLVCQAGADLLLIDQHAAHERIGFEQLKQQYLTGLVERQLLLFPVVLEFDFRQSRAVAEYCEALSRFGFALEHFGSNAFALKELPRMLKEADAERLVRDVIDELSSIGRSELIEQEFERILLKMACHGMLRANQRLSREEMQALLDAMDQTPFISHCPHGRPTFLRWTHGDVERLFKRA